MEKKTEEIQRDKEVKIGAEAYYVKAPSIWGERNIEAASAF